MNRKEDIVMKFKPPFVANDVRTKVQKANSNGQKVIKTYSRATTVMPWMVGFVFKIHNGKEFIEKFITEDMIGFKLGQFAHTRKFVSHGGDKNKARASDAKGKGGKK